MTHTPETEESPFHPFCANHAENTRQINTQNGIINKHTGQWALLLWILGIGIAAMSSIAGAAYYSQQQSTAAISASVHSIDKIVTAYISGNTIEIRESNRRLKTIEDELDKIDNRVSILEKKKR